MKGLGWYLAGASLAFAIFSAAYGEEYDKVRQDGGFSWSGRAVDRSSDLDDIHAVVKPVSMAYYALYLAFFVRMARRSAWKKVSTLGIVGCVVMALWSLILDRAVSFDEVFPAWIAAAFVLTGLQLIVSRTPRPAPAAAAAALLGALALWTAPAAEAAQAPARTNTKKAKPAAASPEDVRLRKELQAIVDAQTDAMLRCEQMRTDFIKMLADNASLEVATQRGKEWDTCNDDVRAKVAAAFKQTSASDALQQAVWSQWLQAVKKRHEQQRSAAARGEGKP